MVLQFIVFGYGKERMTIDVCKDQEELQTVTVLDLKHKIAVRLPGIQETLVAKMELIFAGESLKDDRATLSSYGLIHKSTMQMVLTLDGGTKT